MFRNVETILLFVLASTVMAQPLAPPTLVNPRDQAAGALIKDLKFEFQPVEGADSYTVQISENPDFVDTLPIKDATVKFDSTKSANVLFDFALVKPAVLESSTTYFWRVIANCPANGNSCLGSVSAVHRFTTELSASGFTGAGFSLSRAMEGDNAKKGASFKYAYSRETDEVYTAEYALKWQPSKESLIRREGQFLFWSLFTEGVLSSDDDASDTAVRFGGQVKHQWDFSALSLHSTAALLHEADQSYDTRKNLIELSTSPTARRFFIGTASGNSQRAVQAYWEPTAIVTLGRTVKVADSAETKDTVQRYALRLAATAKLNFLEHLLNLGDVTLTAASTGWLLPHEEQNRHHLFEGAINFAVATDVSVGFEYKRGKEPPEFKGGEEYGLQSG